MQTDKIRKTSAFTATHTSGLSPPNKFNSLHLNPFETHFSIFEGASAGRQACQSARLLEAAARSERLRGACPRLLGVLWDVPDQASATGAIFTAELSCNRPPKRCGSAAPSGAAMPQRSKVAQQSRLASAVSALHAAFQKQEEPCCRNEGGGGGGG